MPVSAKFRILVVEDEWLLASDYEHRLKLDGFDVVGPVPTVSEAFELIEAIKPDCAMLDIQLVGETTFALAERLDAMGVPLMFISGHQATDFPGRLSNRRLLPKPVNWQAVNRELKAMLGVS